MEFLFESAGDQLVARKLLRFPERAEHAKPAFEAIADTLMGYEKRLFNSQGASGGARWDDLAASTSAQKAREGLDPRVLHATGALRRSLTERGDENQELLATDDFLLFGSKLPYAGYHQKGRGVPKRRALQYKETQKRYILKKLQRYLVTGEV